MPETTKQLTVTCCIAGGGPAGIVLGYLLARAGIDVLVLEKHADFFRDFRGDTIHPSTFQLMWELGLLEDFLKVPHQELQQLHVIYNGLKFQLADFSHLPVVKPAVGFMPQWDFLDFFVEKAKRYPAFQLLMNAEATDLLWKKDKVTGLLANSKSGQLQINATLTVACDGRGSILREKAGLKSITIGAPIDVLWFRISKQENDPSLGLLGSFQYGKILVLIERDKYWQAGYIIEKDGYEILKKEGIDSFKTKLASVATFLTNRINEIKTWDDIHLLTVTIDRLEKWYLDGLLCIGDAAHAMSPVGGVGINLAIQDAVAAANILYQPLMQKKVTNELLRQVQERREFPTKMTQKMQVFIQKGIVSHREERGKNRLPFLFWLIKTFPLLRRLPARFVGIGFRPEHVKTPDVLKEGGKSTPGK